MLAKSVKAAAVLFYFLVIHQVLSNDNLCTIDPQSSYVEMCKDGCNKFIIYENYTRALSLKDGAEGAGGCNMTIQAEPGLGMTVDKGVFFNIGSTCQAPCGAGNFISFTAQDSSKCICDDSMSDRRLYATSKNTLTIAYKEKFTLTLALKTIGCLTRKLSSSSKRKNKLSATLSRGDPTVDQSYIVRVECQEGYLIMQNYTFIENQCNIPQDGEARIGSWTKEGVGCTRVKCAAPPNIANGNYTPYNGIEVYRYNDQISYNCDNGYEMTGVGYKTRKCTGHHAYGSVFEGFPPVCTKKDCGKPPSIIGQATLDGSGTVFESTRTVICSRGFRINGPSMLTCLENGTWSTVPVCEIVQCLQLPKVDNAKYDVKRSPYSELGQTQAYGSIWRYTCNNGFSLIGISRMNCREDGTWSTAPICIADKCKISALPVSAEYSCVDCDGNTDDRVNTTRTYRCREGFTDMEVKVACHRSGNWTIPPSCSRVDCNSPVPVENGRWKYTSSKSGDAAELACEPGYQPDSNNELTCSMAGEWVNGSSCELVNCGNPAIHPNASTRDTTYSTGYQSVIRYRCNDGYLLTGVSDETECLQSGLWSPLPTCQIKDCGQPAESSIANGTVTTYTGTIYGSEISYACSHGYMFVSSKAMKCQADETWSELPQCVVVDCKTPANYTTAGILSFNGTGLGDVTTYECLMETKFVTKISVCNGEGLWSIPDCVKQQPPLGKMLYVYIGCGVLILIVIVIVLLVGLCYRRKEKRRKSKTRVNLLTDKSPRRGEGSHCSNDSGLFVDGEPGEFENAPSIGSYDYKTSSLVMKPTWSRYEDSPLLAPYSTDSLTKPRSRHPIGNGIPLPLEMMSVEEDIKNPLYGEQKTDRRGSKNSSPCNFRQSPCTVSGGIATPSLNNFNQLHPDDSNNLRYQTISSAPDHQGNIVDHTASGTMVKYSTNPKHLKVISGQELNPVDHNNSPQAQDTFSEHTLPVRSVYM